MLLWLQAVCRRTYNHFGGGPDSTTQADAQTQTDAIGDANSTVREPAERSKKRGRPIGSGVRENRARPSPKRKNRSPDRPSKRQRNDARPLQSFVDILIDAVEKESLCQRLKQETDVLRRKLEQEQWDVDGKMVFISQLAKHDYAISR
jgi:hypothetical protein